METPNQVKRLIIRRCKPLKSNTSCFLLFLIFLTGCSVNEQIQPVERHSLYPSLPYAPVVVWNNIGYVVSDELIPQSKVGNQFGEVKRYIDPNQSMPEKDGDSTVAPIGSKLYEIKSTSIEDGFVVQINNEYRMATHYKP